MKDTDQLPPHTITIHDHPEPHIMQWSDLELAAVKRYAEQYALQARAQVQGEAFGYIHHFAAHDERGVLIDTTWEADGCADPLPHPTSPSMWEWTHCTPFYTTPQPAQATQAEVTDEQINAVALEQWGPHTGGPLAAHRAFARAILALRPVQVSMTDELFDLICNSIDKADTITMEGDYMLDSYDCIAVVRVMQALLSAHHDITAQAKKETP